jgi:hypothetical protein
MVRLAEAATLPLVPQESLTTIPLLYQAHHPAVAVAVAA